MGSEMCIRDSIEIDNERQTNMSERLLVYWTSSDDERKEEEEVRRLKKKRRKPGEHHNGGRSVCQAKKRGKTARTSTASRNGEEVRKRARRVVITRGTHSFSQG